jgi:hypothetical protein
MTCQISRQENIFQDRPMSGLGVEVYLGIQTKGIYLMLNNKKLYNNGRTLEIVLRFITTSNANSIV